MADMCMGGGIGLCTCIDINGLHNRLTDGILMVG